MGHDRPKLYFFSGSLIIVIAIAFVYFGFDVDEDYFDIQSKNYIQTGVFYEIDPSSSLNPLSVTPTSLLYCKEYTKLFSFYSGKYHEITTSNSVSFNPERQELVNRFGQNEVIEKYKVNIYLNCDIPSWVLDNGSVHISGTSNSVVYNNNPNLSDFFFVSSVGTSSISTKKLSDNTNHLIKTIIFDTDVIENKLKVRSSDNSVAFSVITDTSLNFKITVLGESWNSKQPTTPAQTWVSHRALVDVTNNPLPQPTTANSRTQPITITKVYQTINPNFTLSELNTKQLSGRQVSVEISMSKYISSPSEGVPLVNFVQPNGVSKIKINASFLKQVGDDRYFIARYTLPQNSDSGTWKVIASNVNRANESTRTFTVLNQSTQSEIDTARQTCEAKGGTYYQDTLSCVTNTSRTISTSPKLLLQNARIGLVWEVQDNSGNIILNGDTRKAGAFKIPDLQQQLELVSSVESSGKQLDFEQIIINLHLVLVDSSGALDTDRLANYKIFQSTGITASLSVEEFSTSKLTKTAIQPLQTSGGTSIPLGKIIISRSDIDTMGNRAQVDKGTFLTIKAEINGEFFLIEDGTNNRFRGVTDGTTWSHEFKFGDISSKDDSGKSSEEKEVDSSENDDNSLACVLLEAVGLSCDDVDSGNTTITNSQSDIDNGNAGICDQSIIQCASATLHKLQNIVNDNAKDQPPDEELILIAIIILIIIIMIVLGFKQRKIKYRI